MAVLAIPLLVLPVGAIDGSEPVTTVAGGNGGGPADDQFVGPFGVAFDSNNNLYIADVAHHRVQKLTAHTDTTFPTVEITSPTDGAILDSGTSLTAGFTCDDTGTSGLATCTATLNGNTVTLLEAPEPPVRSLGFTWRYSTVSPTP